ncbi:MAG: hypothetical protein IVW51_11050 [Thermaceae bacterium]|nr:hypothetical protein [Thermaceae bacterium]
MDNWLYFYYSAIRVIIAFVMAKAVTDAMMDRRSNWLDYALGALGLVYLGTIFADSLDARWFINRTDHLITTPVVALFLAIAYYSLHLERDRLRHLANKAYNLKRKSIAE